MAVLVVTVGLVLAAAIASFAYVVAAKRTAGPTRELAEAVRVLDRILAYDDAVTSLHSDLRRDAAAVVQRYHKELS